MADKLSGMSGRVRRDMPGAGCHTAFP